MKKQLLLKSMLLLCALVVGSGTMWADTYEKITSASDLEVDAEYLLVSGTQAYSGISSNIGQHVTVTFTNDDITGISTAHVLKLGGSSNAWTLYDTTDKKYIAYTSTATSKNNYLYQVSSNTDNGATWTLTVSTTAVKMKNNYNTGRWMRYNSDRFCCYYNSSSESTTGSAVTLYKKKSEVDPTTCATPTFLPVAGAVTYGTEIAISSTTDGSSIYYTTNGDDPTTSSTLYNAENKPTITAATTIKAIAVKDGLTNSSVGTASYTIQTPAAPVFSILGGTVTKGETVTLTSATGTTIRYTTDGTTPTATVGSVYSSAITINADQTIKAVAYDAGGNTSSVASYAFTVFEGTVVTFNATSDTGTSLSKSGVSFTTSATESSVYKWHKSSSTTFASTNGKIVRIEFTGVSGYAISNMTAAKGTLTTDGNDGVWTGKETSVAFTASTAQARASLVKVFVLTTATPTFSVAAGEYSEAKSVEISCATDGASIYYTTDGTTPTSSSSAYSSAISITETTTLKAIAIKDGVESSVASATYTMNRPDAPTFDVAAGVFDAAFDLHLSAADGATIYYTTDGTTPTTSSSVYSDKVAISTATTTVKAIAVKSGLTSDVASATYTYDARTTPTFTLSASSVDVKVNDTNSTITLTTNHDGTITVTSSDDGHLAADYNSSTKVITLLADQAGEYTVTVSASSSLTYKDAERELTVNVTKKVTTMTIETTFDDGKDLYTASEGLIAGTVKYNDAALSPQPMVAYTSSNTTVATVDEDGNITFRKAGTTTLTASYAGDDEYEACEETYELTLDDTTPQATEVSISLNNTFFGCTAFTSYTTNSPTSYEATSDNITVTYNKGTGSGFYCNASGIRIYSGGNVTFEAPSGYAITKIVLAGDNSFEDGLTNPKQSTTWTDVKGSTSVAISGETKSGNTRKNLTGATVTLAPTVTISTAKYATYCSPHKLDYSGTGITVYTAKSNGTTVTLSAVADGIVPADAGVVLYKDVDEATTIAVPVTTETVSDYDAENNELVGINVRTLVAKTASTKTNYILSNEASGVGFYLADETGAYLPAHRAYLSTTTSAGARSFLGFDFDDNTTGITNANVNFSANENYYDLSGRRVAQPTKGLYIVNGRKVVIK